MCAYIDPRYKNIEGAVQYFSFPKVKSEFFVKLERTVKEFDIDNDKSGTGKKEELVFWEFKLRTEDSDDKDGSSLFTNFKICQKKLVRLDLV